MGSGVEPQSESHSVTKYLSGLRNGDKVATQEIFERYYQRLMTLARKKLIGAQCKRADEEDVVMVALAQFFDQVKEPNRFPQLNDRHDLWQVLAMMIDRRAKDQIKTDNAQKRRADRQTESVLNRDANRSVNAGIETLPGPDPTPEDAEIWLACLQELLVEYDEKERQAILLKVQGYTHEEIADRLKTSKRTVQRLFEDIRKKWDIEEEE